MKKHLLPIMLFLGMVSLNAQTVFDYETPETSIPFQFFGGAQEGVILNAVANPNASGINTSATVYPFTELADGPDWAGGFSMPNPVGGINATNGGQVCIDVHFSEANSLTVKLETGVDGEETWEQTVQNDVLGEWTTLCYDLSLAGENNGAIAVGKMYARLVLFHGLGEAAPAEQVVYIDNITFPEGGGTTPTTQVILDWESEASSRPFVYFGSSLEGTLVPQIANPNATGINESSFVLEYTKASGAQTWAGAAPDPTHGEVNATNGGMICVDVHFDHIGNIGIKLEDGPEGTNWIRTVSNTVMNEWEQVCIDVTLPGLEDSMNPAAGNVYNKVVLFPDFGTMGTDVDVITYLDNIVFIPDNTPPEDADVTFSLDMNSYTEAFTTPFVIGSFNNFDGEANPLSDDDLDGVWTTTIAMPNGTYEYLYTVDNANTEMFARTSECTTTFDNGDGEVFTNRLVTINEDVELPVTCFNSCYACGDDVSITFNLGGIAPGNTDVWVAGGADFGAPGGEFKMTDDDGDGIFSLTITRGVGYEGFYTFSDCGASDYSCKENIEGQSCAFPDNFNDRFISSVMGDMTISTCYGECATDTDNCAPPAGPTMTTFSVDMNEVTAVSADGVILIGEFSNWGDIPMTDDDGDGVWTTTIELSKEVYEYKFKNGLDGENQESLVEGSSCTITTEDGVFTNRIIDLTGAEDVSDAGVVCYESCEACMTNTNDLEANNNLIKLYPSIAQDLMYLDVLTSFDNGTVQIISLQGELMNTIQIGNNTLGNTINVANYPQGTYMLSLTTDSFRSTQRFVKM